MTLDEIEGHLELGLLDDAWRFVNELPPEQQQGPRAIRVRMLAAFGLKNWMIAEELSLFLSDSHSPNRAEAAAVLHELAAIQAIAGERGKTR